ncbi:MAG: MotA/TolQ/ExbB proton channel family protein, partial [Kiritimatiellae bacterium]|nr:MotA/TolQ/ExbB proton channel family protein [Kiritimatiellia bacterium]
MLKIIVDAFATCDFIGKTIVVLLLGASVWAWSIMFHKWAVLGRVKGDDESFLGRYRRNSHPAQLWLQVTARRPFPVEVPCGAIYAAAMNELLGFLHRAGLSDADIAAWQPGRVGPPLPESEMASVRAAAEGALSNQLLALESKMQFLATITSVAPSLGLFGTVWGIMVAFMGMVSGGSAIVISNVAPGIAGALLTTVAGLFVSIPTGMSYNFISAAVRKHTVRQETFTDEMLADIVRVHGASTEPSAKERVAAAPVVIQTAPAMPQQYIAQPAMPQTFQYPPGAPGGSF